MELRQTAADADIATLRRFLTFPLNRTREIFGLFFTLPGALALGTGRRRAVYIEGSRPPGPGRCLLVAHADTVWDDLCPDGGCDVTAVPGDVPCLMETGGVIRSGRPDRGIGADDRAGLAILWLLRNSGHSLLITDLEEQRGLGSGDLRGKHPEVLARINREHAFAIQFDRRHGMDFKCYGVGTGKFRRYLRRTTGYSEPDRGSFTDICTLCDPADGIPMCGVNLSVGYYHEHTPDEHLVIAQWLGTLEMTREWLANDGLPVFRRERVMRMPPDVAVAGVRSPATPPVTRTP